jgi:Yip1 domain
MDLLARAKRIMLAPEAEWPVIAHEPGSTRYLFTQYVALLAAIPAVCGFFGWQLVGLPIAASFLIALARYLLSFVAVYLLALIVAALAPRFGARRDFASALKLTVYAATPIWLAGVFLLVPALADLTVLGLYAVYLLWTGIRALVKPAPDRFRAYTLTVVLCAIVGMIALNVVVGRVVGFRPLL